MNVLVVLAHPRRDSLTGQVADKVALGITGAGHGVEIADLYGEGFDPLMRPVDEPTWEGPDKAYSEAVRAEMARMDRNQGIVLVFPIWWWSFPAILKGWIDRVWNKGYAYGGNALGHRRALAIGLSASDAPTYARIGQDRAIETQIVTGVFEYCGIMDGRFAFLHQAAEGGERAAVILAEAEELGRTFCDGL